MRLGVNVDHVATIREARRIKEPDPVAAALLAEMAGATSVVAHLREDRRHIKERDVRILREVVKTRLNLEMAPTPQMVQFALDIKPDQATLVPERREEITTEGGLNVLKEEERLAEVVKKLKDVGIEVSIFVDPENEQIKACKRIEVLHIELCTGTYAESRGEKMSKELEKIRDAAKFAKNLGFFVAAGHGLNYQNVKAVAAIPEIEELNIGHSIVARAVFVGFQNAVKEMLSLMKEVRCVE